MKNLFKILELLSALILSAILFPLALIYNLFKIKKGKNVFIFAWKFLVELFKIVFDLFEKIAVITGRR